METNNSTQKSQGLKCNSIKSCIIESWKIFAFQTMDLFKYLWCHLLVAGLGFALFIGESTIFYTKHMQPIMAYTESGYDKSLAQALFNPTWSDILILILSFAAFVIGLSVMKGAVYSQIRFHKSTDSLPLASPFTFINEIKKDARKAFIFDVIFYGVTAIILAVFIGLAMITNVWIVLLALPFLIYLMVIGMNGRLQYVVENKSLKMALKAAFSTGHAKMGGYFITLLLTGIPVIVVAYLALLPIVVLQLAYHADMISHLTGDPSGMPPYVMYLFIVVATLSFCLISVFYILQQWVIAFYTSAALREEK